VPAATSLACKGSIATQPSEVVVFVVVVVRSRSTHTPRQSRFSDGLPTADVRPLSRSFPNVMPIPVIT